jgi:hypothetical protein
MVIHDSLPPFIVFPFPLPFLEPFYKRWNRQRPISFDIADNVPEEVVRGDYINNLYSTIPADSPKDSPGIGAVAKRDMPEICGRRAGCGPAGIL